MQNGVVPEPAQVVRRRMGGDVALRGAVHALVHAVEAPGEIGKRAAAMRQQNPQRWKTVEHAGGNQRADREGGIDGVLSDLRQRELRHARIGLRLHRMDEDRDVKIDRGLPKRIKVEFAELPELMDYTEYSALVGE